MFTLNAIKSSKTGYSANFVVFGRELIAPRDLFITDSGRTDEIRDNSDDTNTVRQNIYETFLTIQKVTRMVVRTAELKAKHMKNMYDKRVKGPFFEEGQQCLLLVQPQQHKWNPRFHGPYTIVEKLSDRNYVVMIEGKNKVVNITKMKHYTNNKPITEVDTTKLPKDNSTTEKQDDTNLDHSRQNNDISSSDSDDYFDYWRKTALATPTTSVLPSIPGSSAATATPAAPAPAAPSPPETAPVPAEPPEQSATAPRRSSRTRRPVVPLSYDVMGGRNNTTTTSEGAVVSQPVQPPVNPTPTSSGSRPQPRMNTPGGPLVKPKGKSYTLAQGKQYVEYKTEKQRRKDEARKEEARRK